MSNSRTLSYFMILTFLFMILIFSVLASSNLSCLRTMAQSSTTTISSNLLTYNNSTYGIKIQYPENWQEDPANGFLGAVVIFSPQGVNQTQGQVGLDISVIPSRNMSLDVLVQKELENYKSLLTNFKIIESSPITFHGNPALMMLSNSTNPISGVVKSINILTIKYGNLYMISYGAKPEIYSAYLPIAEKMINSFEIIKPSVEHNNNNNNNLQKTLTTPGNVVGNNTVAAIIPSSSNLLTYENSTLGIRFEYPTDWKYYLTFVSNSTVDEVRFDLSIASLTISVRDLPFFFQNASIQQLTKVITDIFNGTAGPYFKVLSSENATLSGYPGQKMEISYNYPSLPKINEMSIFTIKNGRLYSVAFDGDAAYYNTFLPTAQKIIDSFRITLAIQPNDVDALVNKGLVLDNLGNHTGALQYYDKALAIQPNYVNALYDKGAALGSLGNNTGALQYYDKSLAIQPNHVNALYNKGLILYDLGNYTEAIKYYDKALAIQPNDVDALVIKGVALGSLGNYTGALQYFDKALAIQPNNVKALVIKGIAI